MKIYLNSNNSFNRNTTRILDNLRLINIPKNKFILGDNNNIQNKIILMVNNKKNIQQRNNINQNDQINYLPFNSRILQRNRNLKNNKPVIEKNETPIIILI